MAVNICREDLCTQEDLELFYQELAREGERLGERFRGLVRILKEMGY